MNLSVAFAATSLAAFLVFTPAAYAQNGQSNPSNNHDTAKGAAVGAVVGHETGSGHAVAGAVGGAAIGHHEAKNKPRSGS